MCRLDACYHVVKGALMREVLDFSSDWAESCEKTIPYYYVDISQNASDAVDMQMVGGGSFAALGDELYSSARIHRFPRQEIFHFITYSPERFEVPHREAWNYDPRKLGRGYYSAANLPRPYGDYREEIGRLVEGIAVPRVYRLCLVALIGTMWLHRRLPRVGAYLSFVLVLPWVIGCKAICRLINNEKVRLLQVCARTLLGRLVGENAYLQALCDWWWRVSR